MSEATVRLFIAKVEENMVLREKLRVAKKADRNQTLAAIVALGAAEGFAFTPSEYESVVASELKAVFDNHRSIFHHHLINVG